MPQRLEIWRRRLGVLTLPLSWLYGLGASLTSLAYRIRGHSESLPVPVISIGNLSVGGAGKTPLVAVVARELMPHLDIAILSRGYGRRDAERARLVADRAGLRVEPELAGDEPAMLSRQLPGVAIAVGARRVEAGNLLLESMRPVFILDDGFQHRALRRDLDIVCLDATMAVEEMACLPRGSFREHWSALLRADVLVWTYWDSRFEDSPVVRRVERLLRQSGHAAVPEVFHARFAIERLEGVDEPTSRLLPEFESEPIALLAAIARPERLVEQLERAGLEIRHREFRPDHHWWQTPEVEEAARLAESKGATCFVTTEKDAVKLAPMGKLPIPVWQLIQRVSVDEKDAFRRRLLSVGDVKHSITSVD